MDERTTKVAFMPILLIRQEFPIFDNKVPISPKDIKRTMVSETIVVLHKDGHN